jgi:glycosyltransferase involved in cell wall biosynthesis
MKKNVIVINYTGRKGGGALDAYETAKALVEQGENVVPIISTQIENLKLWKDIQFEKIILIETYNSQISFVINTVLFPIRQKRKIIDELRDYNIKAVYCPMSTFWTAPINKIFKSALKIVVNHDPIAHSGAKGYSVWLMERPYKDADILVVHSKKFLNYVQKKYGSAVYLPLGKHNLYRNLPNKENIVDYDSKTTNFLFFGRITQYKGLDILAKAYEKLSAEFADKVTLTIVGNGDFLPYKDLYANLNNTTIINRWIKDEEVESAFTGPNIVCVCPYKDATQSGVVLVSYDYGVPVIASDTGGLDEQVVDNKTGLLIPPNDVAALYSAMRRFANEEIIIRDMQSNISSFLKEMSWETTAKQIIDLINNGVRK